jgi:hypothetical protein
VSLFKHQCSWPGCEVRGVTGGSSSYRVLTYVDTGKCYEHGKWAACSKHKRNRHLGRPDSSDCPLCHWEEPSVQDSLEAGRRNAGEDATAKRRISEYKAEFHAQGYGKAAAEAMANKRLREDPPPQVDGC